MSDEHQYGIFEIFAASAKDFAIYPCCGHITQKRHDSRDQPIEHLPIWRIDTITMFNKRRYVCDCDPKHPFDEQLPLQEGINGRLFTMKSMLPK